MKLFFICIGTIAFSNMHAQTKITKYYDEYWSVAPKDKAVFYADFIKDGNVYHCTSYWINTNKLRGISTYPDTVIASPIGMQLLYNKTGHVEDSSFFADNKLKFTYHYYPDNKLALHYYIPNGAKNGVTEGYDETGERIKNYIFEKDAEFKGGSKAWASYINKNAARDLKVKSDSTVTATLQVQFIINESGDVSLVKILKSSGYKNVDDDALRIIKDSPEWNYGIQYNKPVKCYRIQPMTYKIEPEKTKK